jgi:hypothetical protein
VNDLVREIALHCRGTVYVSETDAPLTVFAAGHLDELNAGAMRAVTNAPADEPVEEIDFRTFFSRLTKSEDWHRDEQKAQTKKFLELQKLLEENLRGLKVFKIGTIRLRIYAVGLDRNNNVVGITTQAVET